MKHVFLDKLWIRSLICEQLDISPDKVVFSGHHLSHASSAFLCSPYKKSAILTVDGVGEWATTTLAAGDGNKIKILKEINFPSSLGLLYSAFTAFLGFEVNEGEYKVMGMAPYGKPKYADNVRRLINVKDDGSFSLKMEYFKFDRSLERTYSKKFVELFGKPRDPQSKFFTRETGWPSYFGEKPVGVEYDRLAEEQEYYADIAASIQAVHEELIVGLADYLHRITGLVNLCIGGGVGLNSVANWKLRENTAFKNIFIQPAAGDAGGALGAALAFYHIGLGNPRKFEMRHAYYGKEYDDEEMENFLKSKKIKYSKARDMENLADIVSEEIKNGKVVGWFQGKFEWGPRALGNRSILADPRREEMKDIVNTKIKFREPYRPFAPSVLAEKTEDVFEMQDAVNCNPGRYMLYVVNVREDMKKKVPAITHVDGTARPQLVFKEESPKYHSLISAFFKKTGIPLVLNTSFNLKGDPIVNTPENALATVARSEIDMFVLGDFIIHRKDIPDEILNGYSGYFLRDKVSLEKKKSGEWVKKISAFLLSLVAGLLVLEVGVRIFTKPVFPILQSDPDVGTIHKKNFKGEVWNDESKSYNYIVTNSLGYIGEEYPVKKPYGSYRIALFGDSATEAVQVDYFKNFASQLENALNASAAGENDNIKKFEVMNFGVGGTAAFLQYQAFVKKAEQFNPDLVVVMFGTGNDFLDNMAKIGFDLENYRETSNRSHYLKSFLLKFRLPKYVFTKAQKNIFFLTFLDKLGLYEMNEYRKKQFVSGELSAMEDEKYYSYTFDILKKFRQRAENAGSRFAVFIVPTEPDWESEYLWKKIRILSI
jgi:carbamoyltransferase